MRFALWFLWLYSLRRGCSFSSYWLIHGSQARSQDLKKEGGAFLKEWDNCKRPWPEFSLFLNQNHTVYPKLRRIFRSKTEMQTVFQPKNRWSPKKKVFTKIEKNFSAKIGNSHGFSGRIAASTSQLRHPNSFGGAVFIFSEKIGLKITKNLPFYILYRPRRGEGLEPPPPPSGYATDGS